MEDQDDAKKLSPESDPPTAEQIRALQESLKDAKYIEGKDAATVAKHGEKVRFEVEFSELCKKHHVVAAVCPTQFHENGEAAVITFRCDPWRAIGLAQLATKVAGQAIEEVHFQKVN